MPTIHCYDVSEIDREHLGKELQGAALSVERLSVESADADCEVASVFIGSKVTAEVMDAMPKLKLIATRSTGFNHIDCAAAKERGIVVVNVPTYGENTVAEYAFALLLALARRLPQAMGQFVDGETGHEQIRGVDLKGKVLGVIGAGHIGCNMARIGNGFGMKVTAYDPFPDEERAKKFEFEYAELSELLSTADFVSLHVPYLPSTKHLLDHEKFGLMKQTAFLVNTARGEIIDSVALAEALIAGKLAGAALDVFEGEELVEVDAEMALLRSVEPDPMLLLQSVELDVLKKLPNVIITNHNGFNTSEAIQRINTVTCENISRYVAGQAQNLVKAAA
jgi:D-lactate dehydrogenase